MTNGPRRVVLITGASSHWPTTAELIAAHGHGSSAAPARRDDASARGRRARAT